LGFTDAESAEKAQQADRKSQRVLTLGRVPLRSRDILTTPLMKKLQATALDRIVLYGQGLLDIGK
jgi:hypothetical protein